MAESIGKYFAIVYIPLKPDSYNLSAWILIGLATRCGYALGMHIRNEDRSTNSAKTEILARIWWANFCFERYLSATIGRPSLGIDKDCSVPLPLPVPSEDIEEAVLESRFGDNMETSAGMVYERPLTSSGPRLAALNDMPMSTLEPANSGTYLKGLIKGFEITQEALKLYDASTISLSCMYSRNIRILETYLCRGINAKNNCKTK